jgi:hypothetical protein
MRRNGTPQARKAWQRLWIRLIAARGRVPQQDEPVVMGTLVQPEPDYIITQALLDLYSESSGKACESVDDLIGWANSNRGTVAIEAACNRS